MTILHRRAAGRSLLVSTALFAGLLPASAQQSVTLDTVVVEGGVLGGTGTGPFTGYVPAASVSAGKSDLPLIETPQAVSVVGAEQIADQGARSVTEATRYSPGIRSETFGADPRNDWFLIRGFPSQVNSYFLDGLQLQSSAFATWKVNPYLLDRIDILRGPSSALYGSSNPGGLINLESKRPVMANTGEVSVGVNEFGNVWSGIDVNGVNADGTLGYRIVATGNAGDTKVDFTEDDQFALLPSITWSPDANTSLSLYAHLSKAKTNGQNFLPYEGTVVDAPFGRIPRSLFTSEPGVDEFDREQAMVGYEFSHSFNDALTVRQNLRYGELAVDFRTVYGLGYVDLDGDFLGDPASGLLSRGDFKTQPRIDLFNVDNQLEWAVETGPVDHTFLFGLDYRHFDFDEDAGFAMAPPLDLRSPSFTGAPGVDSRYALGSTRQEQLGFYAQDSIRYGNLGLLLSGRYDDVSTRTDDRLFGGRSETSDGEFSGRAGLIYNFENGLAPYASVSRSFLPLVGTEGLSGDPLKPETATQYEAGIKYQPESWGGSLIGVSVFDLTRENFTTTDGTLFNRQIGEVNSTGVEFEAVGQITDALKVTAAYTFHDVEVEAGAPTEIGRRPTATPDQFGSLWLDYSVLSGNLEGLSVGGGVRYVGSSYADIDNTLKVPDVWLADAAIRYEKGNYAAALNVSNLFDEEFVGSCSSPTACFYGDAREVKATLTYKW